MNSLGLLVGHLLGDYVFQNDWMAGNKTKDTLVCLIHCIVYTLCILMCCPWIPWWGILTVFGTHFPIDRWRLAKWWMVNVAGQKGFAEGSLSPWSVIVVDNVFHLLVLYVVGILVQ